jgi:hypothetical protein
MNNNLSGDRRGRHILRCLFYGNDNNLLQNNEYLPPRHDLLNLQFFRVSVFLIFGFLQILKQIQMACRIARSHDMLICQLCSSSTKL